MYENNTFEDILKRMLDEVPSDVDKREGSIIYDTLSPAAIELVNMYIANDGILREAFADTASREYLILRAKERGIYIKNASYAVYKGLFNVSVPIGTRFAAEGFIFSVIEEYGKNDYFEYMLKCETAGKEGNSCSGCELRSVDYVNGLNYACLSELLIPGEAEEDTEEFRKRYFDEINKSAFGGNRADYVKMVKEISGTGQVKAYRTPNGGGSVTVVITDSENKTAGESLIKKVKETLDPAEYEGLGCGEAPIGHTVTVCGVREKSLSFKADIKIKDGMTITKEEAEKQASEILKNYIDEVNKKWEESSYLTVYKNRAMAELFDIAAIENVILLSINEQYGDMIKADNDEIFSFSSLSINIQK